MVVGRHGQPRRRGVVRRRDRARRPAGPVVRGDFGPWELVDRYARRGVVKGYILYRADRSAGDIERAPAGAWTCPLTSRRAWPAILDGVVIEETLEPKARAHGLQPLLDARDKTQAWCFQTYRDRFNRRLLCTQDPQAARPRPRDRAGRLTIYGPDEPLAEAMAWLEPLSPILGWNGGDEFETARLSSVYGHLQTATDWCMNLPGADGGERAASRRARAVPSTRGRSTGATGASGVCFVGSDGDNVQWLTGNFFANPSYWSSPDRGQDPFRLVVLPGPARAALPAGARLRRGDAGGERPVRRVGRRLLLPRPVRPRSGPTAGRCWPATPGGRGR